MFIKKSEVAILVSNKNNSFVNFLKLYFTEKNLLVRVFETRNSLYLYLLTHSPEAILVSRQIRSNNHKQVVNWIHNKYKTVTVLFDEAVISESVQESYLDVLKKAGPVPGVPKSQRSLESSSELPQLTPQQLEEQFSVITNEIFIDIKRKIENKNQSDKPESLSSFITGKTNLSKEKSGSLGDITYMLPLKEQKVSGYILLDCDDKKVASNFAAQLGKGPKETLESGFAVHNKINKTFVGSIKGKNNVYTFDCKLPDFTIIERKGMLEVDVRYFVDQNPVEFDVYIHMDNQDSDYHYLSPGSSFSVSQIEKLKNKSKKVRVKKNDRSKLLAHLSVSHMIKVSSYKEI